MASASLEQTTQLVDGIGEPRTNDSEDNSYDDIVRYASRKPQ